jgi:hypothetical protein
MQVYSHFWENMPQPKLVYGFQAEVLLIVRDIKTTYFQERWFIPVDRKQFKYIP